MNCNSAFCWNSSSKKQAVGTTWFYIVFRVYSISRDLMVSPAKAAVNKQGKFYWRNRIGACLLIEVMKSSDMAGVPSLFPKSPLILRSAQWVIRVKKRDATILCTKETMLQRLSRRSSYSKFHWTCDNEVPSNNGILAQIVHKSGELEIK